jgi:hypothetical protein
MHFGVKILVVYIYYELGIRTGFFSKLSLDKKDKCVKNT